MLMNKINVKVDKFEEIPSLFTSQFSEIFSEHDLQTLSSKCKEVHFDRGTHLIRKGQPVKKIYFIIKGVIHEKTGDFEEISCPMVKHRAGEFVGILSYSSKNKLSITN